MAAFAMSQAQHTARLLEHQAGLFHEDSINVYAVNNGSASGLDRKMKLVLFDCMCWLSAADCVQPLSVSGNAAYNLTTEV